MRRLPLVFCLVSLAAATANAQPAQPPQPGAAPPSPATIGFMHALHATTNVDTTLAFYTQVFGLTTEIRPFDNPGVALLNDAPGVSLRVAMLRVPGQGFNYELTEFTKVPRKAAQASIVDPGAVHLKILVRDLKPVLAALDKINAPIITRSSAPVRVRTYLGEVDAIFTRDPDGYFVEAVQVAGGEPAGDSNVVGAILGVTVADLDADLKFYRDMLGFSLESDGGYKNDPAMLDLFGVKGKIEYRTAHGLVPGSNARFELVEFRGVPRTPFNIRSVDPGAAGMAIRVAQIEQLLPKLIAQGSQVLSKDKQLVEWSPTVRNAFVKDPNGVNIEIVGEIAKAP
jgi:catechol 2,3-dioxygenase-like lactoylglutathione lyase family enzyme